MPPKRKPRSNRSSQIAVPAPSGQSESVSIRQISNGYIIERSGVHRGKYVSHQEYSAGRPVIVAAAPNLSGKEAAAGDRRPRAKRDYITQKD